MFHLNLQSRYAKTWHTKNGCSVSGFFYCDDQLLSDETLADKFASADFQSRWPDVLADVDGNWCGVLQSPDTLRAAVDHLRSFPLFYAVRGEDVYLSDDAYWVREQIGDETLDELSTSEYLMAGFVTGNDTLYPNVKQIQAGEAVTFRRTPEGISICSERYFRYIHGDYFSDDKETLLERIDALYMRIGEQLLESISGRTIVIPLSAGYDCRLICLILKRLKYKNVIAFTYGLPGNFEAKGSQRLANHLGIPWHFAEYSHEFWVKWFSERRNEYYRYADNLCSLPHIQDWPAVCMLRQQGVIPEDGVVVPGHTVLGTAHVPPRLLKPCSLQDIVTAIINRNYYMQPRRILSPEMWEKIENKIENRIGDIFDGSVDRSVSALECWGWQERQSKYIINSMRAYEMWGLSWRTPLYGIEVMKFWRHMSLTQRLEKRVYLEYIEREGAKVSAPPGLKQQRRRRKRLHRILDVTRLRKLSRKIRIKCTYKRNGLAWNGLIPPKIYRQMLSFPEPVLPYLTRERFGCIDLTLSPRDTLREYNTDVLEK
ncbi:MAG: hypothetical protein JXA11_14630 [Phycisphaerae bacterium]|nr:hypothetical protein [Phycisphaerae bacterium]